MPYEHSRVDSFHCIHKHVSNARVHISEAHSVVASVSEELASRLRTVQERLNAFLKAIALHYTGQNVSRSIVSEISNLRRELQVISREVMSLDLDVRVKIATFDELSWAVGHLNNIEEHLME